MNDPFLHHYRTLGIEPGCSLNQLKTAYRRLVKAWHPDHYAHQNEAGARATAERRMREINRAFRSLSDYHRRNGHLPAVEDTTYWAEEPVTPPFRQPDADSETGRDSGWTEPAPKSPRVLRPLHFVLLGVSLGIIWAAWSLFRQNATPDDTAMPEATQPAAGTSDAAPPPPATPAVPQNDSYFTVGSALGKVLAIQGVPTQTRDNVWYYGKSKVFFVDGVVSRWEEDIDNPLKTEPPARDASSGLKTFGIGSSKDEVKAIQGNPLSETSTRLDYGLSQVYFQEGKVTGWYESPLTPLKIHRR